MGILGADIWPPMVRMDDDIWPPMVRMEADIKDLNDIIYMSPDSWLHRFGQYGVASTRPSQGL